MTEASLGGVGVPPEADLPYKMLALLLLAIMSLGQQAPFNLYWPPI